MTVGCLENAPKPPAHPKSLAEAFPMPKRNTPRSGAALFISEEIAIGKGGHHDMAKLLL